MNRLTLVTLVILQGFIGFIVGTAFGVWWERQAICGELIGTGAAYDKICVHKPISEKEKP